jgi:hypothetical protein
MTIRRIHPQNLMHIATLSTELLRIPPRWTVTQSFKEHGIPLLAVAGIPATTFYSRDFALIESFCGVGLVLRMNRADSQRVWLGMVTYCLR